MSDDRVIGYLRMRAQVEPEPELVARIMSAVGTVTPARSPFSAFLPAAAIAGAVAILTALAIILGQGPNVGPDPTESVEPAPSSATVEELRAAVESGMDVLREAPGVEGIATASVLGELSGATWFSWRPNGDQIVIARSDVDVAESAWWLEPGGQPPARGENVTTTIHVLLGDEYILADAEAWVVQSRDDAPPAFTLATGVLDGEALALDVLLGTLEGDATVTHGADGAATWTLTAPYRDGTGTSEWRIASDGGLVSWTSELVDVTPTLEDAPFVTHQQVEFTPLTRGPVIPRPDTEAPPDPAALGLPPNFPLEPGSGDGGAEEPAGAGAPAVQVDRCEHPSGVYRVDLPGEWWTNVTIQHHEFGELVACSFFAPAAFDTASISLARLVPDGTALTIEFLPDECLGYINPTREARATEVDGWPAAAVELAQGKLATNPPGTYQYVVSLRPDVDCEVGAFIVARTSVDMDGDYETNKALLDQIMASMEIAFTAP